MTLGYILIIVISIAAVTLFVTLIILARKIIGIIRSAKDISTTGSQMIRNFAAFRAAVLLPAKKYGPIPTIALLLFRSVKHRKKEAIS
jgi:hypothetical protein